MKLLKPLLVIVLITGCTVGPDYQAPEPVNYGLPQTGIEVDTQTSMANLSWREYYDEPELQLLIEKALQNNLDFKIARESVLQSLRARGISDISMLPSFGLNLDGERDRASALTSSEPTIDDEFNFNIGLDWQIDLWGKLRRASEASLAQLQASQANMYGVKVSLIAQTAALYYELQDINARTALTESNIDARQSSKKIADLRHKQGIISGLDVRQAEVSLAQEKVKLPELKSSKNQLMFSLSVLIGEPPGTQIIGQRRDIEAYQGAIPAGMPASLLKRRPDIVAAERAIQAANAEIGVATADYFPNIQLTGRYGIRSLELKDILDTGGKSWLWEANIDMPLFDWGRTSMNVDIAKSLHRVALLNYQKAVLAAFQDVSSTLEDYQQAFTLFDLRKSLVVATRENLRIAELRYSNGVVSYLDVLDAQRNHATAEQELSSAIKTKQLAMVNLYRSLGGGWQQPGDDCMSSRDNENEGTPETDACLVMD